MLCYVFCCAGSLHIQRSVQAAVRVRFEDDFHLDWDGRGRVLLKVGVAMKALIKEWAALWLRPLACSTGEFDLWSYATCTPLFSIRLSPCMKAQTGQGRFPQRWTLAGVVRNMIHLLYDLCE